MYWWWSFHLNTFANIKALLMHHLQHEGLQPNSGQMALIEQRSTCLSFWLDTSFIFHHTEFYCCICHCLKRIRHIMVPMSVMHVWMLLSQNSQRHGKIYQTIYYPLACTEFTQVKIGIVLQCCNWIFSRCIQSVFGASISNISTKVKEGIFVFLLHV